MTRFDVQTNSETLASPGADLGPNQDDEAGGEGPLRKVVGSLLWLLTMTRPDITNIVRPVARYAHTPTERLWQAIIKILAYLNGTKKLRDRLCAGIGPGARDVCGCRLRRQG